MGQKIPPDPYKTEIDANQVMELKQMSTVFFHTPIEFCSHCTIVIVIFYPAYRLYGTQRSCANGGMVTTTLNSIQPITCDK